MQKAYYRADTLLARVEDPKTVFDHVAHKENNQVELCAAFSKASARERLSTEQ